MSQMSCTIGAPAPAMYSPSAGASGGPATSGGGPASPTGALEGAVAGAGGGAVSSSGGGGTAVAGAAGALGSEQLMPVLEQLTAAIQQLTTALQPAAAQAPAAPAADAPLNSNTAGVSGGGATTPTACGCAGMSSPDSGTQVPATEPQAPRGASAAPQAAAPPPADVSRWVTGDTNGLDQDLLGKLAQLGERMGQNIFIKSGNRTHKQQEDLYRKYLDGTGNKAARPGTSNHEHGDAADAQIGGKNLASNPKALKIATELGLHFPVRGEPWHVEVKK